MASSDEYCLTEYLTLWFAFVWLWRGLIDASKVQSEGFHDFVGTVSWFFLEGYLTNFNFFFCVQLLINCANLFLRQNLFKLRQSPNKKRFYINGNMLITSAVHMISEICFDIIVENIQMNVCLKGIFVISTLLVDLEANDWWRLTFLVKKSVFGNILMQNTEIFKKLSIFGLTSKFVTVDKILRSARIWKNFLTRMLWI